MTAAAAPRALPVAPITTPAISTVCLAGVTTQNDDNRITSSGALPLWTSQLTALVGEGESGKTWLAAHTVLDVADQNPVLIFDGEMSARSWRKRLGYLNATPAQLGRVFYAEMTADSCHVDHVVTACQQHNPALIVWDSALSLLSRVCRSENDNSEVSRVYDQLRDIVRRTTAAGLIIDHTPKGSGTMTSRGASAKFNALDVSYGMRLTDGSIPGPLSDWEASISIEKDRHGLLGDRNDRGVLFHPLGAGNLSIDLHTTATSTNRLSGNTKIDLTVQRINQLSPPPTSGNQAHERLGGHRATTLAAFKQWSART